MIKETRRKGFNFYRSYYDVFNELSDVDKLIFIKALLDKEFLDVEPEDLTGMVKFAWISQYNSIDQQVKGYKSKTKDPMQGGWQGGLLRGEITPTLQEEEKGKEKGEEEEKKTDDDNQLIKTTDAIKNIEVIHAEFIEQIKKGYHSEWAEATYMRLKLKKGSLTQLILDFKNHLVVESKNHKNVNELKSHLNSWLNKLDTVGKLNQYKTQKVGAL